MNAGCLRPIEIIVPEGSMLSPRYPAAVVAGNVESQPGRDQLPVRRARRAGRRARHDEQPDLRQRRAINTTRRSARARRPGHGFDGGRAVHTHMTNSRLTDPEILENRFPVVLEDFHIRNGSGGRGKMECRRRHDAARSASARRWNCAILSGHRRVAPFGLDGGEPGQIGRECRAAHRRHDRRACRAAPRPCSRPERRSRSSRRPVVDSAFRRAVELHPRTAENVELRGAGTHRRCGLAVARPASARTRRNGSSTAPLLKRQQ